MGGYARITQDFMAAVLRGSVPEQVSGSVQLIPKVPYGTFWSVDSGEDVYTVPASPINCDIINGKLSRNGEPYVDVFADDLGTDWSAIYTNVLMDGHPRHIYPVDFTVKPGGNTDLNHVGKELPTAEVVQITLGAGYEARDQFRDALSTRGLHYKTVTEIPFEIELVGSGSAVAMFNECWSLTHVPEMDTSSVTITGYMFSYCSSLVSVPDMDTAQVTDASYMFYSCSALTHVPDMNTSQVTNMDFMFMDCGALTDGNVRLIGRHPSVSTTNMILYSGLTREPFYDAAGDPI